MLFKNALFFSFLFFKREKRLFSNCKLNYTVDNNPHSETPSHRRIHMLMLQRGNVTGNISSADPVS